MLVCLPPPFTILIICGYAALLIFFILNCNKDAQAVMICMSSICISSHWCCLQSCIASSSASTALMPPNWTTAVSVQATWPLGYWVPDMSQPCFTGWHLKVSLALGIPLLVIICIGIPLLPYLLLRRHRHQLQTSEVHLHLGFIYRSYRSVACLMCAFTLNYLLGTVGH